MWREGYVSGGDTRFFVRALGHGDDLAVLLHGWPEDGSSWRRVAPLLVDAGYRVVCPGPEGVRCTEAPQGGYDAETLADEISQLIRNLHVRKAVLVGHDWGGAVALATAFRHPGRVRALVSPPRRSGSSTCATPGTSRCGTCRGCPARLPRRGGAAGRCVDALRRARSRGLHRRHHRQPTRSRCSRPRAWLAYYRTLSRRAVAAYGRCVGCATGPGSCPTLRPTGCGCRLPWSGASVIRSRRSPSRARVAHDLGATLVTCPGWALRARGGSAGGRSRDHRPRGCRPGQQRADRAARPGPRGCPSPTVTSLAIRARHASRCPECAREAA
jgi:pimeloyl-ACP methyl ester carboxylesterase